jgi:uracil-DNA glycosylase
MARQLSLDETAAPLVPERPTLPKLRAAAAGCTACDLYRTGTQTVFGEGARGSLPAVARGRARGR